VKRRLIKLGLFLFLGAIVNVAVAWGCAIWTTELGERTTGVPSPRETTQIWNRIAGANWPAAPADFTFDKRWDGSSIRRIGSGTRSFGAKRVGALIVEGAASGRSGTLWSACALSSGWPLYSFEAETYQAGANALFALPPPQVQDGLVIKLPPALRKTYRFVSSPTRIVPLRPIWRGFATNTTFYAAILWLLLAAPFALRRLLRTRRSLCPHCAYPVGAGNVCTECGNAVPVKRTKVAA
jgi:hypothetical protein